jgi:chromosome segregation ATPase
MADTIWYFIGDGVLGSGDKCVYRGEEIPSSLLTKKRLQHFIACKKVSDKPIPERKDDKHLYDDCEKELAEVKKALKDAEYIIIEKNQAIKELNEAIDQLKQLLKLKEKERDDWKKKYEDLKKKCKNK